MVHHGKEGRVYISGAMVGKVTSFEYDDGIGLMDATVKESTDEELVVGYGNGSGSVEALLDTGNATQNLLRSGASVLLRLFPVGYIVGQKQYSGTTRVENAQFSSPEDGPATVRFGFSKRLTEGVIGS